MDDDGIATGYLVETTTTNVRYSIEKLDKSGQRLVSWERREKWCKQLVEAVSVIHRQGKVVGSLGKLHLGTDTNDNLVLQNFWTTIPYKVWNEYSASLPPEYHHQLPATSSGSDMPVVPATDLYQLGWALWKLTAQRLHFPSIGPPVPQYLADIIGICLSEEPRKRKRAVELLELVPRTETLTQPADISSRCFMEPCELLATYDHRWCDICGKRSTSHRYHCRCCSSGDFDLCESCFIEGLHCYDSSHYLIEIQDIRESLEGSYCSSATEGRHRYFTSPKEDGHRDFVFV